MVVGQLKSGQTENALGQFISFPLVREKKFTDITDKTIFAELSFLYPWEIQYGGKVF